MDNINLNRGFKYISYFPYIFFSFSLISSKPVILYPPAASAVDCNSSAFGFHSSLYVISRTLQQVQSPGPNCYCRLHLLFLAVYLIHLFQMLIILLHLLAPSGISDIVYGIGDKQINCHTDCITQNALRQGLADIH